MKFRMVINCILFSHISLQTPNIAGEKKIEIMENKETKVTVFGTTPENQDFKKIEFVRYANEDTKPESPSSYQNVQLIVKDYYNGMDLMAAWDEDAEYMRAYYLGHFNDGIV